jgi:hypothetical protein
MAHITERYFSRLFREAFSFSLPFRAVFKFSADFSGRHFPSVYFFEETSSSVIIQQTIQGDIFLQFTLFEVTSSMTVVQFSADFSGRHFPSVYYFEETSSSVVIKQTIQGAIFLQFASLRRHLAGQNFSLQPTFQEGIFLQLPF